MKQILNRVTITGADDSVAPTSMLELSREFPFVEWGILMSKSNMGAARFPSADWLRDIEDVSMHMNLSAHLCGRVVRQVLMGNDELWPDWQIAYKRAQLNFHAESTQCDHARFAAALSIPKYEHLQWIFQLDGAEGNAHLNAAILAQPKLNAVGLFDLSGGAGILPEGWPEPRCHDYQYVGYAGGLNPYNVREQLELIEQTAQVPCWIDVETHVRSTDNSCLDMAKVRAFLEAAQPWVIHKATTAAGN